MAEIYSLMKMSAVMLLKIVEKVGAFYGINHLFIFTLVVVINWCVSVWWFERE